MAQADRDTAVEIKCRLCSATFHFRADAKDINAWKSGELIQNALPYLSLVQRELLKTSTCGTCWDEIFPVEYK